MHSTKTFGFTEYVLEKTNANYNACFIYALLNIPIEYFSRGRGFASTGFFCVVNLFVWFYPVVGPIPGGCSCGRGVFCGESGEPGETQKQATAAGKNAARSATGMAETDKQEGRDMKEYWKRLLTKKKLCKHLL